LILSDVANEQIQAMPIKRFKFRAHVKAHKTVLSNERWFRKGEPFLGKPFTVKKTVNRHATVIKILSRARKRAARAGNDELADAYRRLQAKLTPCRPGRRCGSSACPKCASALQRVTPPVPIRLTWRRCPSRRQGATRPEAAMILPSRPARLLWSICPRIENIGFLT
jgi:hypothetical protein